MALTKTPYEFLVRFNKDGSISGSHIKFLERFIDMGQVIFEREGQAEPISIAGQAGFPLASILTDVQAGALSAVDASTLAVTAKDAEIAVLQAKLKAAGIV